MDTTHLSHVNGVEGLPKAIAAYSSATKVNYGTFSILHGAGVIGINPETDVIPDSVSDQVH